MKFEKISQEDREKLERRLYKTIVEEFRREKIKDGYYKYIVSLQEFKFITDITDNELKESISIAVDTMEELKKINNNDGMNKKKLKEIQDKEHRGEPFETLNIWNAIVTEQLKELLNRAFLQVASIMPFPVCAKEPVRYQIRLAKPALLILHPTNRMSFRLL